MDATKIHSFKSFVRMMYVYQGVRPRDIRLLVTDTLQAAGYSELGLKGIGTHIGMVLVDGTARIVGS